MKLRLVAALLLAVSGANAFAPASRFGAARVRTTARSLGVDPSVFSDLPQHVHSLRDAFTSLTISDVSDAIDAAVSAVPADVVDPAAATAAADAAANNGWFGFLTGPIESLLYLIHSAVVAIGLDENAWGVSIVMLTLLIKAVTFPLTRSQLESTNKMQALQPTIKDLQAKYQSNPEVMNQKIAEVYQTNEVNPLAGCLPSLVQIPVFVGLYRAVLTLARENALDEPFLWLPNLEGPTYGVDPTHGSDWLFANWQDGTPSMGWENTIAFLVLPAFLVVSQFVSMQLMQPKSDDPQQQQANIVLKFLPLMIGWFSLTVPAALSIYWVVNNIVTTATTLFIRNTMKTAPVTASPSSSSSTTSPASSIFAPPPMREKPAGFGTISNFDDENEVKPITAIDAEVISKELTGDDQSGSDGQSEAAKKKRGGAKKKKRKN